MEPCSACGKFVEPVTRYHDAPCGAPCIKSLHDFAGRWHLVHGHMGQCPRGCTLLVRPTAALIEVSRVAAAQGEPSPLTTHGLHEELLNEVGGIMQAHCGANEPEVRRRLLQLSGKALHLAQQLPDPAPPNLLFSR